MQLDKLTLKSQEALQEAQRHARESSHQEIRQECHQLEGTEKLHCIRVGPRVDRA